MRNTTITILCAVAAGCTTTTAPEVHHDPTAAANETFSYWDPGEPREVPDSVGVCGLVDPNATHCVVPSPGR